MSNQQKTQEAYDTIISISLQTTTLPSDIRDAEELVKDVNYKHLTKDEIEVLEHSLEEISEKVV